MTRLGAVTEKIRSKNAGPFWLTVDIFCGDTPTFERVSQALTTRDVAALFGADPASMKRFDISALNVIKFSLPRPTIQGAINDPDMHGASWAALLQEFRIA